MNLQYVTGVYAMITYLTSYLCKPEHAISKLMKKASRVAYGKDIKGKMLCIGNTFLTTREVSTHEAIKRVLSLPMRHSNVDVLYVPTGLKKNRTRMLKSLSILEKMHPVIKIYLHLILLTNTKIDQITYIQCAQQTLHPVVSAKMQMICQQNLMKSIATLIQQLINDVKLNPDIIVSKNELAKMQSTLRYSFSQSVQAEKPRRALLKAFTVIYALEK